MPAPVLAELRRRGACMLLVAVVTAADVPECLPECFGADLTGATLTMATLTSADESC